MNYTCIGYIISPMDEKCKPIFRNFFRQFVRQFALGYWRRLCRPKMVVHTPPQRIRKARKVRVISKPVTQGTILCTEKICNFLSSQHTEFSSLPDKTELFLATQRTVPCVIWHW